MITVSETIPAFDTFSEELGYSPENSLFFDIETTGFSPDTSMVFLIGVISRNGEDWQLTQYLAEKPSDEEAVLRAFLDISEAFSTLIHFNGSTFDLPYLIRRAESLHLPQKLKQKASLDLYQKYRPLKKILGLEHMNQTSLEAYIGWKRCDRLTGKHMAALFQKYAGSKEAGLRELLLLHNHDDMLGMTCLLRLTAFVMLFNGQFAEILSAGLKDALSPGEKAGSSPEYITDNCGQFLTVHFRLLSAIPGQLGLFQNYGLTAQDDRGCLTIPVFEGTLRHFFPEYRNYYYLPLEDQAIHKSVASYVDRAYREPAKAANCYIKKSGAFLPQPKELFTPAFKQSLETPELYFTYSDEFLADSEQLKRYLSAILTTFL